jgi:oxygen-dependent protoporphyrinogen oxidase
MTPPRVAVVGAGITGLTVAYTLREEASRLGRPLSLVVLETAAAPGGHARTLRMDGFTIDIGPNGFLTREPQTLTLIDTLGLRPRMVRARSETKRRYLLRGGRLCRVPDGPVALLSTPALSWRAKLRLLAEPFAPGPPGGIDETVHAFATRRLGAEIADTLVDAAVAGISAGDSRRLSAAAQFPQLVEMERAHGSLLRAMFAPRPAGREPVVLASFDRGLGLVTETLAAALGRDIRCRAAVVGLMRHGDAWRLALDSGEHVEADVVVLATSARAAAGMIGQLDAGLARALGAIESTGLAVVALGYRVDDVRRPLDGYGFLTARSEHLATLGVVWESSLFPDRAPEGHVLLRVMLGGARRPEIAGLSADEVLAIARAELTPVLGIAAEPVYASVHAWPGAISQYVVGHRERRDDIRARVRQHRGLAVCGTSYDGVSFNDGIRSARETAQGLAGGLWRAAPDTPMTAGQWAEAGA